MAHTPGRSIKVAGDAQGNAIITGDGNIVIFQTCHEVQSEGPLEPIGTSPYKGLVAFHEEDADLFFGREEQIQRLWTAFRALHESGDRETQLRLLPILGPSGSGKSSLARAGLIPELARKPLPGFDRTRVAVVTPGAHPIEALAGILARIATNDLAPVAKAREFAAELERSNDRQAYDGLRRIADALPEIASSPLIVLVDQFEEIYSLCDDSRARTIFIHNLLEAASDTSAHVSVIVTLRSDFLGETQEHPRFNSALSRQAVIVPAMNEQELRRAIAQPAIRAGHPLDEAVIELLVSDTKGREGALPLLQFALTRIWSGMAERIEPVETLRRIGGVGGALAGEAQRIYDSLSAHQQVIARRAFIGLVQLGEGIRDTRRRLPIAHVVAYREERTEVEEVIKRFSTRGARLITLSANDDGTDAAEVTHEALFEHWDLLKRWLDTGRDDIRFQRRLDESARNWDNQGRPDGSLWRAPDLHLLRDFHDRAGGDMTPLQLDFYIASDRAERAEKKRERQQLQLVQGAAVLFAILLILSTYFGFKYQEEALKAKQALEQANLAQVEALLTAESASVPSILKNLESHYDEITPRLRRLHEQEDLPEKHRLRVSLALLPIEPSLTTYLREQLLKAEPQGLRVIREALVLHQDELKEGLWELAENPEAHKEQRLRAACALAAYDSGSSRWAKVSPDLMAILVSQNPLSIPDWVDQLRPVGQAVIEPLVTTFLDGKIGEKLIVVDRALVANIVAEYGADSTELLTRLIQGADARSYAVLLPKLRAHREEAIARLRADLGKSPAPQPTQSDRSWVAPDADLVHRIEGAYGLVKDEYALVQTMSLEEFHRVAEGLRNSSYRPIRMRPYFLGDRVQVAAVWQRDGQPWRLLSDRRVEEILARDKAWRSEGYFPVDVAGYVADPSRGSQAVRYAGLWVKPVTEPEDARMFVGLSSVEQKATQEQLAQVASSFEPWTLHEVVGSTGEHRYSSIWWKLTKTSPWRNYRRAHECFYEAMVSPSNLLVDVCVSRVPTPPPSNPFAEEIDSMKGDSPSAQVTAILGPLMRGIELLGLGRNQEAISSLSSSIEQLPTLLPPAYAFRAIAYARLGNSEAANRDIGLAQKYTAQVSSSLGARGRLNAKTLAAYGDAVVSAHLGEDEQGMQRLDEFLAENPKQPTLLFKAARAFALAAQLVNHAAGESKPEIAGEQRARAERYKDRAVELIMEAIASGFTDEFWGLKTQPDLASIRGHPGYEAIVNRMQLDRQYAALWYTTNSGLAWQELHGLTPESHIDRCRELAGQGYRPAAISVASIDVDKPPTAASVWHRAIASEATTEKIGRRQINAALALLDLGESEEVRSLLKHGADLSVRTSLIHRFSEFAVDPQKLIDRFDDETDITVRRALILALGTYGESNAAPAWPNLTLDVRKSLADKLLLAYQNEPDPGLHSAIEWLLRRGRLGDEGLNDKLQRINSEELASKLPRNEHLWYVNDHGHTMAVVRGPVTFAMGSPGHEPSRKTDESLHRTRISRTFAVATKETTVDQFLRFQSDFTFRRSSSPDRDGPIIDVTWYEAARYCRWLSEQEGIPEDQMCFPSQGEIDADMILPGDYLTRTGYRLPTEAEWEYACRAGAETRYCYGNDQLMMWHYAPMFRNRAGSVGTLKPNDLGLFDVHGNVWEWCMDEYWSYAGTARDTAIEDAPTHESGGSRVIRGGSFESSASFLRCAGRHFQPGEKRFYDVGFRVARTLPE